MKAHGPISTTYQDQVCDIPKAGSSDWGGMGSPLSDNGSPVTGVMKEVQYANLQGAPDSGKVDIMKIQGGGTS
jgi:hypothetical protein